jgi:hypothetical protein
MYSKLSSYITVCLILKMVTKTNPTYIKHDVVKTTRHINENVLRGNGLIGLFSTAPSENCSLDRISASVFTTCLVCRQSLEILSSRRPVLSSGRVRKKSLHRETDKRFLGHASVGYRIQYVRTLQYTNDYKSCLTESGNSAPSETITFYRVHNSNFWAHNIT